MTTIHPGFTFTDDYSLNTFICRGDNDCGLTYCDVFGLNNKGEEECLGGLRLSHHLIGHAIHDIVEWCDITPDQWDAILSKVSEDVLEEILGQNREYSADNVHFLLQEGDNLFDAFNAWLLSELNIRNPYNR